MQILKDIFFFDNNLNFKNDLNGYLIIHANFVVYGAVSCFSINLEKARVFTIYLKLFFYTKSLF